jgi:hypothetical protein
MWLQRREIGLKAVHIPASGYFAKPTTFMWRRFMRSLTVALVLFQSMLICPISMTAVAGTPSSAIAKNPTDLPAYPNLWKASVTGGGKGVATLYEAATHDTYETVLAWYRSRLVGASEEASRAIKDLVTFKLPHGESVTVYRSDNDTLITLGMDAR